MVRPEDAYEAILRVLRERGLEFELFRHRPVFTYDDAAAARDEAGFSGTEGKSLVLRSRDGYVVCTTLQGRRLDFRRVRAHLGGGKVRMATADELRAESGAEPGNAYPFGFDARVRILVDPAIYREEWVLFSPALPTATVQVRGCDLSSVFHDLPNQTEDVDVFVDDPGPR